jgi:Thioredoxin domain-containing protein
MDVKELTKDEFLSLVGDIEANPNDWKYKGDKPCIVNFTAPWCVYCQRLKPILEEFADKFINDIYIYNVDVDKEEDLDKFFNIRTIPTLLFCPINGNREALIGTMPKHELEEIINKKLIAP